MPINCHGDPTVNQANVGGGTRQYFGPPTPPVTAAAMLTTIYNGFVCPQTGTCPTAETSTEDVYMGIVQPGDLTKSYLWYKVNGTQATLDAETPDQCGRGDLGNCGLQMPLPGGTIPNSPAGLLPQAKLDLICNWIVQGAKNN